MNKKTINKIDKVVCEMSGITLHALYSDRRDKIYSKPRTIIWIILHDILVYTYNYIGRNYGRDHSTIIQMVAKYRYNQEYQKIIEEIISKLPEIFDGIER
jgi:chromosomal replication initiation ATPase DnaA